MEGAAGEEMLMMQRPGRNNEETDGCARVAHTHAGYRDRGERVVGSGSGQEAGMEERGQGADGRVILYAVLYLSISERTLL